jgi:hypothetical protein
VRRAVPFHRLVCSASSAASSDLDSVGFHVAVLGLLGIRRHRHGHVADVLDLIDRARLASALQAAS